VVDPSRVTEVKRVDDLDEYTLYKLIVSEEREVPDDGVKVAGAEVVNEEGIGARVNLTVECKNILVERNSRMKTSFASLATVQIVLLYTLDGIVRSRSGVDCAIHDTK
jgi:hypothetical protein